VIATVGYVYPKAYGPDIVGRLEAACERGKSSLHGTGFNPGFVSDVIPATLSISVRVDHVHLQDISAYRDYADALFAEPAMLIADCLGETVQELKPSLEYHW
jgi:hypothetical protein